EMKLLLSIKIPIVSIQISSVKCCLSSLYSNIHGIAMKNTATAIMESLGKISKINLFKNLAYHLLLRTWRLFLKYSL
ncbi:MAG: hypothetical protein PHX98_02530, partial [Candidatus Moranbacteria bacterium]|nr:hypothetical protein [Candidatus Moranbacteria bacterium]